MNNLTLLPPICGNNLNLPTLIPIQSNLDLSKLTAVFSCALHMHQPTIPAGNQGELISNLQHMFEHPGQGDNHNAGPFAWCYSRMGDFIPQLIAEGCNPRIMLDYSGNLLWGLEQMGREDILNPLKKITCEADYHPHVEWLGTMWSHAVASSTPIRDIPLQVEAWRQHFTSIFGKEALARVRGFSPPEMHLPNHPDTCYEYIKALKEAGYQYLLVQEHSVEQLDGTSLTQDQKYLPNLLLSRNSQGESISITALIKTQGSDTKLVAQMQPYFEAKSRGKQKIGGVEVPSLVTQIADGENGGVMMNEYPRDFSRIWYEIRDQGSTVTGINGAEYLELITQAGAKSEDYPLCQPVGQYRIWQQLETEAITREKVAEAIAVLKTTDPQFTIDGASWTNHLSWVTGYDNILGPMEKVSQLFHQKYPLPIQTSQYREALLYNLLIQTSCFRYWGQGMWTDYAHQLVNKAYQLLDSDH